MRPPAGHVERTFWRGIEGHGENVGASHVVDMHEVTALAPVLEYARGLALRQRAPKEAGNTRIGGVGRHPGAVDVVIAERHKRETSFSGNRRTQVLLMDLRRGVHVPRIE